MLATLECVSARQPRVRKRGGAGRCEGVTNEEGGVTFEDWWWVAATLVVVTPAAHYQSSNVTPSPGDGDCHQLPGRGIRGGRAHHRCPGAPSVDNGNRRAHASIFHNQGFPSPTCLAEMHAP